MSKIPNDVKLSVVNGLLIDEPQLNSLLSFNNEAVWKLTREGVVYSFLGIVTAPLMASLLNYLYYECESTVKHSVVYTARQAM